MKKVFFLLVLLCVWVAGISQVFNGTTGNVGGYTNASFTANVSTVGTLSNNFGLESVTINLTHRDISELEIYLQSPNGMRVNLCQQIQSAGANFNNTIFNGNATKSIRNSSAPYSGDHLPDAFLGSFNDGQSGNGTWRLVINDMRNTSNATVLRSWSLKFSNTPSKQAPKMPSCNIQLPSGNECKDAPMICDFSVLCGVTKGVRANDWTGSGIDSKEGGCFGLQNNTFIRFVASETTATFALWVKNTRTSNYFQSGIQIQVFKAVCNVGKVTPYNCYRHILSQAPGHAVPNIIIAEGLVVGETYFLLSDGFNSDECDFTLTAVQGVNILNVDPVSASICEGQNVELTATGGNGNFTWAPGTSLNTTTGSKVIASPTVTQKYTVTSTMTGVCPQTKEVTVTVNPKTAPVTGFSYTTPVCSNAGNLNPVLSGGFTTGGTFSSTTGLSINPNTGVVNVQSSTPGSYTITYKVAAKDCVSEGESTTTLVINSGTTPVTTFSYQTPVCSNVGILSPQLGTGFTAGGVFSAATGLSINASTGVIDVQNSTAGTYVVTYSVAATSCSPAGTGTANIVITAVETPNTTFSYQSPVCAGSGNLMPVTGSSFKTGGLFSAGTGLSINPNSGEINVANSTPGSYTITYKVTAKDCVTDGESTATLVINSGTTPVTTFSYLSPVCNNAAVLSPQVSAGFTTGGVFSSTTGLSINASTGVINLQNSTPGTYTVSYSVAATTCSPVGNGSTSIVITAVETPNTSFSYQSPVCFNSANLMPVTGSNFKSGGVFSAGAGLSINATTGEINVVNSTPGSYTVSYSVAANGCSAAGQSQATIVIQNSVTPTTGFSYRSPVCLDGSIVTVTLGTGFTTGGTFTGPAGVSVNSTTGDIDMSKSTAGTYIITYQVAASGCRIAATGTAQIVIQAAINPVTGFSYASPVCLSNTTLSPILATNFTTGGVFSSTSGLVIDGSTGVINVGQSTAGTYTVRYLLAANGCRASGDATTQIVIQSAGSPVVQFSYPAPLCASNAATSPVKATGFTDGGTYSSTTGLNINSSTGVINVQQSTPGRYTVKYNLTQNNCTAATEGSTDVEILAIPDAPEVDDVVVCTGKDAFVSVKNYDDKLIYSWYKSLDFTNANLLHSDNGSNFGFKPSASATYYVYASNGQCKSNYTAFDITVNGNNQSINLGNDTTLCKGEVLRLNAPATFAEYRWNTGATTASITVTEAGKYAVYAKTFEGCDVSDSINVLVAPSCVDIYFPNAFTPNGDGKNDYFGPIGNLSDVRNYEVVVYNRWGELIFQSRNPFVKWDGTYKGKPVASGTFTWYAHYQFGAIEKTKKGTIVIIR